MDRFVLPDRAGVLDQANALFASLVLGNSDEIRANPFAN
jgi:hypothetical protein